MPNKWKIGGVTGLAVDKDDNVWVYDRPNDLRDMELKAELTPTIADCCTRPPSMIHIDKNGNVIDGNAEKVTDVTDVWTFARDLSSRDPNWKLVATEAGQ